MNQPMSYKPADLSRSIFAALGLEIDNPLAIPTAQGPEVLLLVDGFGSFIIDEYASLIPTIATEAVRYLKEFSSHFPTTTVSNLTSLGTGERPGSHGMVGYTMRIPFASEGTAQLLNGLKWDPRIDPETWQRKATLFERGTRVGITSSHIAAKRYEGSGFTRAALRGAHYLPAQSDEEILEALAESTRSRTSFTYLYLSDVDEAGHAYGVGSSQWLGALRRIESLVKKIKKSLPTGARFWITADHGMVNAGAKVVLGEGNPLLEGVDLLGGEPRARHLYFYGDLVDERIVTARRNWSEFFGDRIELLDAESAYGSDIEPGIKERIGKIIAAPRDNTVLIEAERKEAQSRMVGHHGARTDLETSIPLLQLK